MQVNSINSVNFKSNYSASDLEEENQVAESSENIDELLESAKTLESMLPDRFTKTFDEEGNEVTKKSFIGTAVSIAGTGLVAFALCKKFLKSGAESLNKALANKQVTKALEGVKAFAAKQGSKIAEKIQASPKLSKAIVNILSNGKVLKLTQLTTKAADFVSGAVKKVGVTNVLAGAGAVAGATYVSTTDSNNDGVADIAQKGVNAYKGAVEKMGIIGDAIKVLS